MDELDYVRQLGDVEPLRPQAYEQARAVLRAEIAAGTPVARLAGRRPAPRARIATRTARIGLAAGVAAAAAVAVALAVTSGQSVAGRSRPPAATQSTPVPATGVTLTAAASYIQAHANRPAGNATLVITSQANGDGAPTIGANLYTDSGAYYWAPAESGLPESIADHEDLADGADTREVAAALYAVHGNLAIARTKMVNATPNPFRGHHASTGRPPTAAQRAKPRPVPLNGKTPLPKLTGTALREAIDNYLWNNSMDALTEGAGNPLVRAGVLRLLSTVPEITVRNSVTRGQPTLTLTAGKALFSGNGQQVLTIDARTGIPISTISGTPGQPPSSVVTYQVTRVKLANIAAGRF